MNKGVVRVSSMVIAAIVWWLAAPTAVGGRMTYLTTFGTSMELKFLVDPR